MRLHCVEHGIDPAQVAIVVTGGAGPVHATSLLAKLRARCVICPPDVGVASAGGLVVAPRIAERIVTELCFVDNLTYDEIARRFDRLHEELVSADADLSQLSPTKALYMRLEGQAYDIRVTLPDDWSTVDSVYDAFSTEYRRQFGRSPSYGNRPQIVAWLIRVVETDQAAEYRADAGASAEAMTSPESRSVYFGQSHGWVPTPVYRRATLGPPWRIGGPVLLEEPTSTTVVLPGQTAAMDEHGNVRIESRG
jgi:N-methylhydantoinase A/oxoprolinase/acetone carboxylase beta subunit